MNICELLKIVEAPVRLSGNDPTFTAMMWDSLEDRLLRSLKKGMKPQRAANGFWKLESGSQAMYWAQKNKLPILIGWFTKTPNALTVQGVGKHPAEMKPFASDLYNAVLADHKSIQLKSDKAVSDEGFKIWTRLLAQGHKIFVQSPDNELTPISSPEQLKQFHNKAHEHYRFVITN
jgi:hypothetical protein